MIYVVGCNHGIQPRDPDWLAGDAEQAATQKARFGELIDTTVKENEGKFVAEEWGLRDVSRGQFVANKYGIPWSDINTCFHDLDGLGIPRDYVNENHSEEQKQKWNRDREKVMLERIKAARKDLPNGLVICGFEHMDPLVKSLRAEEIEAQPVDYRNRDWYQPTFSGDS